MPSPARLGALMLVTVALSSCSSGSSSKASPSLPPVGVSSSTPSPAPAVVLTKGAPMKTATCTDASCASMAATASGLKPSTRYEATCNSDMGKEFYRYSVTTDASGGLTTSTCFYGYAGHRVWIVIGGIESNHLLWS